MSKVCSNCGTRAEDDVIHCEKCGNTLSTASVCSKHRISKNEFGECELCMAEEETAAASSVGKEYKNKKVSRTTKNKYIYVLFDKIILVLLALCIIAVSMFFVLNKYKKTAGDMLTGLLPKKTTSSYVLFQMKNIKELQALKLNKADYYQYKDDNNRNAELIIRYYIYINFNLDECKITQGDDGSFAIELKKPQIKSILLDGIDYTEKKQPNYYPGIEIFSISSIWESGTDFKMGEVTNIAQKYINDKCTQDTEYYTQEAFDNIKEKLMAISDKLNLNVSDIIMEGVNE